MPRVVVAGDAPHRDVPQLAVVASPPGGAVERHGRADAGADGHVCEPPRPGLWPQGLLGRRGRLDVGLNADRHPERLRQPAKNRGTRPSRLGCVHHRSVARRARIKIDGAKRSDPQCRHRLCLAKELGNGCQRRVRVGRRHGNGLDNDHVRGHDRAPELRPARLHRPKRRAHHQPVLRPRQTRFVNRCRRWCGTTLPPPGSRPMRRGRSAGRRTPLAPVGRIAAV